ncbi:MAG: hypothetical protein G01um101417_498 [Parcubacteria group bacterium Gr01-1014_17]|nr:MAG: hypothetical protein G01um101417_498 [Parcubacteria group bacterium Gr01-1014_17]
MDLVLVVVRTRTVMTGVAATSVSAVIATVIVAFVFGVDGNKEMFHLSPYS